MSSDYLKAGDCNLQFRVKQKLRDRIDDIAHFHHLTRGDYIRLQLERAVVKEEQLLTSKNNNIIYEKKK